MNIEKKEWKKPEVKEFFVKEETEAIVSYGKDGGAIFSAS